MNTLPFLPLCHWCKLYAKLLESEGHLINRVLVFFSCLFPCKVAPKTEIYLFQRQKTQIKSMYAAKRRQECQLYSALPVFTVPESTWKHHSRAGSFQMIASQPPPGKTNHFKWYFCKMYEFWSPLLLQLRSARLVIDGIIFPAMSIAAMNQDRPLTGRINGRQFHAPPRRQHQRLSQRFVRSLISSLLT